MPVSAEHYHVNGGPRLIKTLTIMAVIVTIIVALRISMRLRRHHNIGLDDGLILAAFVRPFLQTFYAYDTVGKILYNTV